jgi:hypothetical protein
VITRAQKIEDGAYIAGTPGSHTAEAPNYTARLQRAPLTRCCVSRSCALASVATWFEQVGLLV